MNEYTNLIQALVDSGVWGILLQIILAVLIFTLVRGICDRVAGYILFRAQDNICVGSNVRVNGFSGYLEKIGMVSIVIRSESMIYIIPTNRWQYHEWQIYLSRTTEKGGRTDDESRVG